MRKRFQGSDGGSALVLVMMLIVFLGIWMASVAILSQSSQTGLAISSAQTNRKADLVNGALQQSLQALSVNPDNNSDRRWGVDISKETSRDAKCSNKILPLYKQIIDGIEQTVKIECTEAQYSGQIFPLASFVLTGSNTHIVSGSRVACTSANRCITGQDGGLNIKVSGSNPCDATNTSRLLVSGGILNVSGAWVSTDCSSLEFIQKPGGARPTITQPDVVTDPTNCPAASVYETGQTCACPASVYLTTASSSGTWSAPCTGSTGKKFSDIDPGSSGSSIRAYLDSVSASLDDPVYTNATVGFKASYTGYSKAGGCVGTGTGTIKPVIWLPGIIDNALMADLNAMSTTGTSSCGGANVPVVFSPGVYRFIPDSGTSFTWSVNNSALTILGGVPNADYTDCDTSKNGVQFQFAGASFINIFKGAMFLCGTGSKPVIAAPTKNPSTTFFWDPTSDNGNCKGNAAACANDFDAFLTKSGGSNASTCDSCFFVHGLVFAPAAWADISMSGKSTAEFGQGAIFRALTISATASILSNGGVDPSPPFDGDRIVQLRFYDMTPGAVQRDLGIVQVVIKDFFGRRIASGYKILVWRVLW